MVMIIMRGRQSQLYNQCNPAPSRRDTHKLNMMREPRKCEKSGWFLSQRCRRQSLLSRKWWWGRWQGHRHCWRLPLLVILLKEREVSAKFSFNQWPENCVNLFFCSLFFSICQISLASRQPLIIAAIIEHKTQKEKNMMCKHCQRFAIHNVGHFM